MQRAIISVLVVLLASCAGEGDHSTTTATPSPATTGSTEVLTLSTNPTTVEWPSVAEVPRGITVGGMGAEYSEPVRCILDLGVTSRRSTVGESSRAASEAAAAMTGALSAAGVDAVDIQTSDFSIGPYYDDYPFISGYETRLRYRVSLPDPTAVGPILADAIDAGGDSVEAWGIRFEADPTDVMETARAEAWEDVVARAESLAALAGVPLGEVVDIHEKVLVSTSQGMMEGGEGDSASFAVPVSPGVAGVVVLLTVTFAIGD